MLRSFLVLAAIIYVSRCATIPGSKDELNDDNLLNGKVEVQTEKNSASSSGIHSISDAKTHYVKDDKDAHLDKLLRDVYDKFVVNPDSKNDGQHKATIGDDGKAYKESVLVPNAEKKEATASKKSADRRNSLNDDDDDGQGVSMSHVLNSVRELIEKLAKSEEAKKKEEEVRREELAFKADAVAKKLNSQVKKEYKFETIQDKTAGNKKEAGTSNNDIDFDDFKKRFLDMFLNKKGDMSVSAGTQDHAAKKSSQVLIGSGKDNLKPSTSRRDGTPTLIGSGKDSKHHISTSIPTDGEDVERKNAIRTRFNRLYDELRKETANRVDSAERNRRERLELVKKDLIGLLNGLQTSVADSNELSFHDENKKTVDEVYNHHRALVDEQDRKSEEQKRTSKLAVVESLIKELRHIEETKREEQLKKEEEEKANESVKRVESIFMEAFKRELAKRKQVQKKVLAVGVAERETVSSPNNKKLAGNDSGRELLVKLMGELDKRIVDEKSQVEERDRLNNAVAASRNEDDASLPEKKHSNNVAPSSSSSIERELDNILADLSNEVKKKNVVNTRASEDSLSTRSHSNKQKRMTQESAIDKALEGFNIGSDDHDSALKHKFRP